MRCQEAGIMVLLVTHITRVRLSSGFYVKNKAKYCYLIPFRESQQNPIDWMAYKYKEFIAYSDFGGLEV